MKASTAGSASPSLSPDSRFSEWRTSRGTRGFVTTDEESTGSVGDSSAPSRQASSQPSPTTQCATSATSAPVIGIAERELAERQVPRLLEHLGLDLEAVAEQDHDQRDDRQVVHEARARVELEDLQPALAEGEARQDEHRRERQERPPREACDERARHEQRAEDEQHDLELHRDRVSQRVHEGEGLTSCE